MKSYNYKNNSLNSNKNNIDEESNLKEIISPMVLEIIGKKYTDAYIKHLDKEYYELIEDLLKKKRFSSFSNSKLFNDNKAEPKGKNSKNNIYWKDYNFVNNTLVDKKINKGENKDKQKYANFVEISNNNQSNDEEQSESIVIKDKEDEILTE